MTYFFIWLALILAVRVFAFPSSTPKEQNIAIGITSVIEGTLALAVLYGAVHFIQWI